MGAAVGSVVGAWDGACVGTGEGSSVLEGAGDGWRVEGKGDGAPEGA